MLSTLQMNAHFRSTLFTNFSFALFFWHKLVFFCIPFANSKMLNNCTIHLSKMEGVRNHQQVTKCQPVKLSNKGLRPLVRQVTDKTFVTICLDLEFLCKDRRTLQSNIFYTPPVRCLCKSDQAEAILHLKKGMKACWIPYHTMCKYFSFLHIWRKGL